MVENILSEVKLKSNCIIMPQTEVPLLKNPNHILPPDLEKFYSICGGIVLFEGADYSITIVSPDQFVPANPVIVGDLFEEDRSSNWYIIGANGDSQYITIDLSKERVGKCYDSFTEVHGVAGENSVIANSFTELLGNLVRGNGDYWFWLKNDFTSLGDAYDDEIEI